MASKCTVVKANCMTGPVQDAEGLGEPEIKHVPRTRTDIGVYGEIHPEPVQEQGDCRKEAVEADSLTGVVQLKALSWFHHGIWSFCPRLRTIIILSITMAQVNEF